MGIDVSSTTAATSSPDEYRGTLDDTTGTTRFRACHDGNEQERSMRFVPTAPKSGGAGDSSTENFLGGIAFLAPDQVTAVENLMDLR